MDPSEPFKRLADASPGICQCHVDQSGAGNGLLQMSAPFAPMSPPARPVKIHWTSQEPTYHQQIVLHKDSLLASTLFNEHALMLPVLVKDDTAVDLKIRSKRQSHPDAYRCLIDITLVEKASSAAAQPSKRKDFTALCCSVSLPFLTSCCAHSQDFHADDQICRMQMTSSTGGCNSAC